MICDYALVALLSILTLISALSRPSNPIIESSVLLSLTSNLTSSLPASLVTNVSSSAPAFESDSAPAALDNTYGTPPNRPVCESRYGTYLNIDSCYEALRDIIPSTIRFSFGNRGHGFNIQLPRRMSSSDGLCVIDIFYKEGTTSDFATSREILSAAESLVDSCVRRSVRREGGYIRDIGESKNLVIVLSSYNPVVACYGSVGRRPPATQELIDLIPTTYTNEIFGRPSVPGVNVVLPVLFNHPVQYATTRKGFYVKVDSVTQRAPVVGRWFDVWAAVVALNAMCARDGAAGVSRMADSLIVQLDRRYKPEHGSASTFNANSSLESA